MSQRMTKTRLAAGIALLMTAAGMPALSLAQDAGMPTVENRALTAEEVARLRELADLPPGGEDDIQRMIGELGLSAHAPAVTSEMDHIVRGAALIGYVPEGAPLEENPRSPGDPLEGRGRDVVRGEASVITGDTLRIGNRDLRLQGVRAPGGDDTCIAGNGEPFDCGEWAADAAAGVLEGRDMACAISETVTAGGLPVGWCEITLGEGDIRDFGHLAVRAGLLLSSDAAGGLSLYREEQAYANHRQVGIWSAEFVPGCKATGVCS